MKFLSFLTIATICAITLFSACKNEGDAARDAAVQSAGGAPADSIAPPFVPGANANAANPANPATPTPSEPPQNAAGVWHYTCPKGCAGGAGAAAPCPKCGTTLAHNTAYHPTPAANPATTITPSGTPGATTLPTPGTVTPPAEPAQNAAGVWHYTCASGCAGGAGTAAACAKCGKTLAHNAGYHK